MTKYTTVKTFSTKCSCGSYDGDLLCAFRHDISLPAFYICWKCRSIGHIGVSPVPRIDTDPERSLERQAGRLD